MERARPVPKYLLATTIDDIDTNYYQVLSIPRDASTIDIKSAYHRALLTFHPDKNHTRIGTSSEPKPRSEPRTIEISLIREAYATLSAPESRLVYDSLLLNRERQQNWQFGGSRPAQVVSLENFRVEKVARRELHEEKRGREEQREEGRSDDNDWAVYTYTYPCRCGGMYQLSTDDLENGYHLVGCESCSEVIWVGYEVVVEEDGDDA